MACAGCEKPILDKFLLHVLERAWHAACVRCADCRAPLADKCYSRDNKLFCRNDFFRQLAICCMRNALYASTACRCATVSYSAATTSSDSGIARLTSLANKRYSHERSCSAITSSGSQLYTAYVLCQGRAPFVDKVLLARQQAVLPQRLLQVAMLHACSANAASSGQVLLALQ